MPRSLSTGLRFALRVAFRSRLLRWFLILYFVGCVFDQTIELATDASWFASVGHSRLFWHVVGVRALLFWAFAIPALLLAVATMRVVAHPGVPDAEPPLLPPALRGWNDWRQRVPKLGWLVLLLAVWILGRRLAGHWVEALQFGYGGAWDASPQGLRAGWWVFQLPFVATVLQIVWEYVLVLFAVLALGGGVRSLPFLAARQMVVPHRWERLLLKTGVVLLLLRALGYVLEAVWLPTDGLLRLGDLGVRALLCVVGVLLCLWTMLGLRRSVKRSQLPIRIGALLILPSALGLLFWPLRSLGNGIHSSSLDQWHEAATRSAWELKPPAPLERATSQTPRLEQNWPIWDEHFLLLAGREQIRDLKNRVIDWQDAVLRSGDGKNLGLLVGVPAESHSWSIWNDADERSANGYLGLDLNSLNNGVPSLLPSKEQEKFATPLTEQFYGMAGPSLLGREIKSSGQGVSGLKFDSVLAKLAWAWRLRSPVLLFEGFGAKRLLVFRDIHVAAQKLAPMFAWDASSPGLEEWTLEGYGVTRNFPGSFAPPAGSLREWNAARPALLLHLDPVTGAMSLGAPASNPFVALWKRALPELWDESKKANAPFSTYEEANVMVEANFATAHNATELDERFWSVRDGKAVRVRRALVPLTAIRKLKNLDALAHRSWKEPERLENGVPVIWPDVRAPGGYWVARPYFAISENQSLGEHVQLDRVLLSAASDSAPIGEGDKTLEAIKDFDSQLRNRVLGTSAPLGEKTNINAPDKTLAARSRDSVEAEILQLHDEVEKQAAASRWVEFNEAWQREKELIQELARRRMTMPKATVTPSPSGTPAGTPSAPTKPQAAPTPKKNATLR